MGDIGYYDEEANLYFVSRAKDLIKARLSYQNMIFSVQVDNYFFSPIELEEQLENLEAVSEACVWGAPDAVGGNDLVTSSPCVSTMTLARCTWPSRGQARSPRRRW